MENSKRRYRALPLIASPLERHPEHDEVHELASLEDSLRSRSELNSGERRGMAHVQGNSPACEETPIFRARKQPSSIELVYDLFFVANLTTFTNIHTMDDAKTVKSYIGFFTLLWFNWLQVTLYDVRFSIDSIFERVCKALHLGIMIGFAVTGTRFNTSNTVAKFSALQQFSIIMVASRLILLIRYGYVLCWVRSYGKVVILPLVIHMGAFAVGAVICLGLTFTFNDHTQTLSYLVWYLIAVLEALVVFASSNQWRSISFESTHLKERIESLTSIILGEGAIVLTTSITYVTKGEHYSAGVIGQIIACTLIIYLLYMLYFDQTDNKQLGTIRQSVWALAHFPFHVTLILLLEGTSRFVTWRIATESIYDISVAIHSILSHSKSTSEISKHISDLSDILFKRVEADASQYDITSWLSDLASSNDPDSDTATEAVVNIFLQFANATFKFFKISAAKSDTTDAAIASDAPKDPLDSFVRAIKIYDLVFEYLFVAAGCMLLFMAILIFVAKKRKCAGDYTTIALRSVFGLGLAGVATFTKKLTARLQFLISPWILPTVLLSITLMVILEGALGYVLPAPETDIPHDDNEAYKHGNTSWLSMMTGMLRQMVDGARWVKRHVSVHEYLMSFRLFFCALLSKGLRQLNGFRRRL